MRVCKLWLGVWLSGCVPEAEPARPQAEAIAAPEAISSAVLSDRSTEGVFFVRRTGPLAAPVLGRPAAVQLDGQSVQATPGADGLVVVEAQDGRHTLSIDGAGAFTVDALPGPLPTHAWREGWWTPPGAVTGVVASGALGVISIEEQLYALTEGGGLDLLADLNAPIVGLRSVALDEDGISDDALVWSDGVAALLQYHAGRWLLAGGVRIPEGRIASAAVGGFANDGRPALAVVWSTREGGRIEVWQPVPGEQSRFLAATDLDNHPTSAAASKGLQGSQLTVLHERGWWRFSRIGDALLNTAREPPVSWGGQARIEGGFDFDGDGTQELVVYELSSRGQTSVQVLSLDRKDPFASEITFVTSALAFGDVDGDGRDDLVGVGADGSVARFGITEAAGPKQWNNLADLQAAGPIAILPRASGDSADLLIGRVDRVERFEGGVGSSTPWMIRNRNGLMFGNLTPTALIPVQQGTSPDLIAAITHDAVDDSDVFTVGRIERSDTVKVKVIARWSVPGGEGLRDAAWCGDEVGLVTRSGFTSLRWTGNNLEAPLTSARNDGLRVACADTGGGVIFGLLTAEGIVRYTRGSTALVEAGWQAESGAYDLALATAGPALGEAATCHRPGCEVLSWPLAQGGHAFAERSSAGLRISGLQPEITWPWTGELAVGQIDGTGAYDLGVLESDGTLAILRALPDGTVGVPEFVRRMSPQGAGGLLLSDVDGDGYDEVLTTTIAGALTAWADLDKP